MTSKATKRLGSGIRVLHGVDDILAANDFDEFCSSLPPIQLKKSTSKRYPLPGSLSRHRMLQKIVSDVDSKSLTAHIWIHKSLVDNWLKDHILLNNIVIPGAATIETFYSCGE